MYKVMTPGPTQVKENVRMARSLVCTNPDLDEDFVEFYKDTCELISSLLGTKNETLILDGEGILGLEAACASLTEPGDKVLVIENGVYGEGFADFVSMYGGVPEFYHADRLNAIDPDALSSYLKEHHDYKYATVVHCDTPSGMLNPVEKICPLLKEYGILTVVDSVFRNVWKSHGCRQVPDRSSVRRFPESCFRTSGTYFCHNKRCCKKCHART